MGQVVLENCALAAQRAGDCGGRGLAPNGIQDVAPPGLSSHSSSVKILCCTVAMAATTAPMKPAIGKR